MRREDDWTHACLSRFIAEPVVLPCNTAHRVTWQEVEGRSHKVRHSRDPNFIGSCSTDPTLPISLSHLLLQLESLAKSLLHHQAFGSRLGLSGLVVHMLQDAALILYWMEVLHVFLSMGLY